MIQNQNFSYNGILNILQAFASSHPDIYRFIAEDEDQMSEMTSKEEAFPVMFIAPLDNTYDFQMNEYRLRIYAYDRLMKDRSNVNDCRSRCDKILNDLDVWLKEYSELPFEVDSISIAYPFSSELMTDVTGWYIEVTIQSPSYSVCEIPFLDELIISGYSCSILYTNEYLKCSTLGDCGTFTNAIDNLQFQIDNISGGTGGIGASVTGGTYSNVTGNATFYNATGGTFDVTGFFTSDDDIYVSGMTFNEGTYDLTINKTDGTSYTESLAILGNDLKVTGGTYNPSTGVATFTNNSGGTFNISGFLTGYTDFYTTGGTLDGKVVEFTRNDGNSYSVDLSGAFPEGSGTTNYVTKWTSPNTIGDSLLYSNDDGIGIGTEDPLYKLRVSGSTGNFFFDGDSRRNAFRASELMVRTNPTGNASITVLDEGSSAGVNFFVVGSETTDVALNRAFGVPRDVALAAFTVANNLNIINSSSPTSTGNITFYAGSSGILTNNTPAMQMLGSGFTKGFIGVNTALPTSLFNIKSKNTSSSEYNLTVTNSDDTFDMLALRNDGSLEVNNISGRAQIRFKRNDASADAVKGTMSAFDANGFVVGGIQFRSELNDNSSAIIFKTTDSSSTTNINDVTERMRITSTGNVGINTDTPTERLHVQGNTVVNGTVRQLGNTASGTLSVAFGLGNIASNAYSFAIGNNTRASGNNSHAQGQGTVASATNSHAEGQNTLASNINAHAEGSTTVASGQHSHAEGLTTIASGSQSHAEGWGTLASGAYSHAEGFNTVASATNSHAEGFITTASGLRSHAQGEYTLASGQRSHASGVGFNATNRATAGGTSSFAHFRVGSALGDIGAYGNNSAILGGLNHNINTLAHQSAIIGGSGNIVNTSVQNSVILGGAGISATTSNTVYVPNFVAKNSVTLEDILLLQGQSSDPSAPADGTIWHNTTENELRIRLNGVSFKIDVTPI